MITILNYSVAVYYTRAGRPNPSPANDETCKIYPQMGIIMYTYKCECCSVFLFLSPSDALLFRASARDPNHFRLNYSEREKTRSFGEKTDIKWHIKFSRISKDLKQRIVLCLSTVPIIYYTRRMTILLL